MKTLNVREPTPEEITSELGEYFGNDATMKAFPNAFRTPTDLFQAIKYAPLTALSSVEILNLDNCGASEIIRANDQIRKARDLAKEYGRDIESVFDAIKKDEPLPAPIVLKEGKRLRLLGGNTRIMASIIFRRYPIVKMVDLEVPVQVA